MDPRSKCVNLVGLDPGGLFANGGRVRNIARARELLGVAAAETDPSDPEDGEEPALSQPCPCCGGRMIIIEIFEHATAPRAPPRFGAGRS